MASLWSLCRPAVGVFSFSFRKVFALFVLAILFLAGALPASAGTWNAFGPKMYTRGSGAPVTVTDTLSIKNPNTTYTLHLVNGSLVDSQLESVGQTIIVINGVTVIGQQVQFTQNTTTLDVPVTLLPNNNEIDVQVRGQVGGAMTAQIIGVDNDAPTIVPAVAPAANAAGWENAATSVTFTCDDATSGIAFCPAPVTVSTETAGQTVSGTAADLAGNTASASVSVKLDLTPPAIQPTVAPAANAAGWNNGNVTVSYTCTDALSGVATCPSSTSVISEGVSQVTSGAATDVAGNSTTDTTTVQIDKTPPVVTISSPSDGAVFSSSSITVSGTVADSLSGIASATCNGAPAAFTGGTVSCAVTLVGGSNPISISATDAAGNVASQTVTVQLQTGPAISGIDPTSGATGTTVVISGSGFGTTPSSDALILIGSIIVAPMSWSDTSISFVVPATSAGGVVSVTIGGTTLTGPAFTVSGRSTSPTVFLSPGQLSLVVGDTYSLDAFDSNGAPLHSLPWSSSDLTIIELSSDDPPVLIAKAPGTATINAGTATSTITVYPGPTLPLGTVKWKVPDDGNGVYQIIPAVPSASGVADVFTVMNRNPTTHTRKVQAITADGHVAWTTEAWGTVVADFQGGFLDTGNGYVQRHDGMTGQALPEFDSTNYSLNSFFLGVHTDGTTFFLDNNAIVGLDPQTAQEKFCVALPTKTTSTTTDCPGKQSTSRTNYAYWSSQPLTVAGDGYFYLNYNISGSATTEHCDFVTDTYGVVYNHETKTTSATDEFHLLRVASDGTNQNLPLYTAPSSSSSTDNIDRVQAQVDCGVRPLPGGCTESMTGQGSDRYWRDYSAIITNADQGVLLLWTDVYMPVGGAQTNTVKLTAVLGGQVGISIPLQGLASPQQDQTMKLYLQLQNGDFVAIRNYNTLMAFNAATGQIHWTKPVTSYWTTPLYALADGTMAYREGYSNPQLVTVDAGGNELSRVADPKTVQSWTDHTYHYGSTDSIQNPILDYAMTYAAQQYANGTAVLRYQSPQAGLSTISKTDLTRNTLCSTFLDNLTAIAISNGRLPEGPPFTKSALLSEIQRAASSAGDYTYDGPSSTTHWDQCLTQGCVAKFPVWFTGESKPDNYRVKDEFADHAQGSLSYLEGLSQYDGSAIWLRLFDDWDGAWLGLNSQYITKLSFTRYGQVNSYGLGTLLHEVLHKRSVGGGFTHKDMWTALGLSSCDGWPHNACSDHIATACFPDN